MALEVIVFDVNETLTDMAPLRQRFADVGLPPESLGSWFAGVLRDGFALTALGEFRTFGEVAAGNFAGVLDGDQVAHVIGGFPELSTHPDVPDGLRALANAGLRLVTLTNGSAAMSQAVFDRAGVLDLLEHRLSVDDVQRWKPAPEPYLHAADVCGLPADRMALVAVHPWDVHGAQRAGMTGIWLNRSGTSYPPYLPDPDIVISDLRELTDALAGQATAPSESTETGQP
jgi:2-haloacid dehalogenase